MMVIMLSQMRRQFTDVKRGKAKAGERKWDGEVHWVFLKCRHLSHGDTSERGRSRGCRLTNLQIPVDYPINMAVMDAL